MNEASPTTTSRDRLAGLGAPRASAIPEAQRHTARVARLRRFIVWGVGGIVAVVGLGVAFQALKSLPADLRFANIAMKGTKITIATPKIVGYRPDGRPFEITAKQGVQDVTTPDVFELEGLEVKMENSDDNSIRMAAGKGVYNAKNDHATLSDGVMIRDDKNFDMRLRVADMDFKASVMSSQDSVKLSFTGGEVTAKSVEFAQKERRASFSGGVRSVLYGETDETSSIAVETGK